MANEHFNEALKNFMKDSANGGAIRHLYDLGYSMEEIREALLFPASTEDIQAVIDAYEVEKHAPEEAYEIIKEQNKFGKTTFRKIKKKVANSKPDDLEALKEKYMETKPMKYETILFDMDGTILDTLEDLKDAVNYVMRINGEPEHSLEEIRSFVGNGMKKLMIRSIPGGEENPTFEKQFKEYQDYYPPHSKIKTKPYDGILDFMRECKSRGIKLAVVSNKQQPAVTELADYYFEGMFDAAVGDGEGRTVKPAPDAPFEAMKRIGANPKTTLYVGDSDVDAATAENAGLDCVLVTWGFRERELLEQKKHIAIIDEVKELYNFI